MFICACVHSICDTYIIAICMSTLLHILGSNTSNIVIGVVITIVAALAIIVLVIIIVRVAQRGRRKNIKKETFNTDEVPIGER